MEISKQVVIDALPLMWKFLNNEEIKTKLRNEDKRIDYALIGRIFCGDI